MRGTRTANIRSHEYGGIRPPHGLLSVPEMTLRPFLYGPLGRQLVSPPAAALMAAFLVFAPPVGEFLYVAFTERPLPENLGHPLMMLFALMYFAASFAHWVWRWVGHWRGHRVHSFEAGYSLLAHLTPLPTALTEILMVPGLVALASWFIVWPYSVELSLWLMAGALSLLLMAAWEQRRNLAYETATIDDTIRSEAFGGRWEKQEQRERGRTTRQRQQQGPEFVNLGDDGPKQQRQEPPRAENGKMTKREALQWLGLAEGATRQQIEAAFRHLMQANHPDHGGSNFIATKLNEARRVLLRR